MYINWNMQILHVLYANYELDWIVDTLSALSFSWGELLENRIGKISNGLLLRERSVISDISRLDAQFNELQSIIFTISGSNVHGKERTWTKHSSAVVENCSFKFSWTVDGWPFQNELDSAGSNDDVQLISCNTAVHAHIWVLQQFWPPLPLYKLLHPNAEHRYVIHQLHVPHVRFPLLLSLPSSHCLQQCYHWSIE